MNNEISIRPIIKELEHVYDAIAKINNLKAPRPLITIQTKGRKSALGWHWENKWESGKKKISEINVCAESLKGDPVETLIHEMVHHHNVFKKINDCNGQGYHNKYFKTRAESYGLNVEKCGRHGWGLTSLSDDLKKKLKTLKIDYKVFNLVRNVTLRIPGKTKMVKYRCGCTTVRCATHLNAFCNICKTKFEEQ